MASILIIDDEPANRLLLATILMSTGHSVTEATDGVQALAILADSTPNMVIMDLNMPGMDGFEFLKKMRSDPSHRDVSIVVHTATSTDAALQSLLNHYAVDYVLPKPFEPEELLRMVSARFGDS